MFITIKAFRTGNVYNYRRLLGQVGFTTRKLLGQVWFTTRKLLGQVVFTTIENF